MVDKNAEEREKERDLREQINNSKAKRFQTATTTTMNNNNDDDEDVESQFDGDLRQKLNQMRNAFVESDESSVRGGGGGGGLSVRGRDGMNTGWHNHDNRMQEEGGGGVGGGDGSGNAGPTRKATFVPRQTNNNKHFNKTNPSDIPPRFRKLQQGSSSSRPDGGFTPEVKTEPISPIQHTETYEDTTESKNWVPPENGWRYLQAFHDYFAQRGVPAPVINVVMGKVERQKGFYGQTQYDNKMYYPLEILSTEEEARQNAARAFCLKMGVSLQQPSPPLPTTSMSETVKKNIYNIVSDSGIWANGLPDLYKKTYNEELPADFLRSLQHSAHLFNIEEPVPKRFIIYKVLESVVRLGQIVQMEDRQAEDSTLMWRSPPLPGIGSQLKVLFSYAYSGEEIYLQKAEHEDLLYQIEEVLQTLSQQSPPSANANLASSLVAACYEEGWYRAKVLEVQRETVLVSFVDYGNRESVTRKDVRHLPSDKLVTLTPPLAISCCLQKPTGVEWKEDITSILFSLSESETGLSAKVLAHRDTQCVIDLCLPSGESLASRLTRPHSTSTSTPMLTHSSPPSTTSSSSPPPPPTPSPPPPPATVEEEGEESTATTVTSSTPPPSSSSTPPPPSSTPPPPPVSSPTPTAMAISSQTTAAAAALATPETQLSTSFLAKQTTRLFAEDPEPLCLPEADLFAIFVCRVLTESSILLRFVDDEYSDKLDQLESQIADRFQSWPTPKEVHKSNVYACVILPSQTEEDDDDDEEDEEGDGNKFYRARVLHKKEDGTYECYLLDHGDHETVPQGQLREIDSSLNTSLPYQAILASLYGLDSLTPEHRAVAVEALIKFTITDCSTFMAMRRDGGQPHSTTTTTMAAPPVDEDGSGDTKMDPIIINRVRKVICCLKEIVPDQVVKIYHDVYKEHLENVEEIIRQIPGYGFWKRSLEVELFDTSQDEDFSVNQTILSLLAEVTQLQAEGKDGLTAIHNYFGDSGGSASIDSKSVGDGKETMMVDAATGNLDQQQFDLTASSSGHSQSQSQTATLVAAVRQQNGARTMDRVFSYVQEQADSVAASASSSSTNYHLQQQQQQIQQQEGEESPAARSLYTWSTNVNNEKDAQWMSSRPVVGIGAAAGVAGTSHQNTPSLSPPTPSTHHHVAGGGGVGGELDGQFPPLPSWYGFELNNFSALFVLHAESPSDFVAIPYDMRQPLLQMEEELTQYFSVPQKETEVLSRSCLYAVNREGVWHRTLYISSIEHLHRVLYPDYHQFDTVSLEQLYPLPQLFYSLPFLGRKMALGAVAPTSQDWPESVKFWFIQNTQHRSMYGLIWDYVDSGPNNDSDSGKESFVDSRVPKPLRAQLVDTSGEEDVIVDDVLCDKGWARHIQPE